MNRRFVLLLLVALALGGLWLMQQGQRQPHEVGVRTVAALEGNKVVRMTIERPGTDAVVLVRRGDDWHLSQPIDYPADNILVAATLRALADLKSDGVISSNADKAEQFGVGATQGIRVGWFYDGDSTPHGTLVVGKMVRGFSHTYVTANGAPSVYRVAGPLRVHVQRDVDGWRDKSVLKLAPESVTRLVLQGKKAIELNRGASGWTRADGGPADSDAVTRLVQALVNLKAVSFAPEGVPSDQRLLTLSLWNGDDRPTDLVIEAEQQGMYRLVVDADPQRFLVPKAALESWVTDPEAALAVREPEPG